MKRNIKVILIGLILLFILVGTTLLTAQTNIPTPRQINGTVTNKRPIKYEKGKYGGVFIDYIVGEPKTFCEAQCSDTTSSDIIAFTSPYLFDLNYDTGKWSVELGDHKKGKTGPGYDLDVFDDGSMAVTIYLRKDMYYTDGTRLTADDFVYYYNEIICNDDIGHPGNPGTYVEMPDGDEIQIHTERINRWTFKLVYPRTAGEPELNANYNIMPRHIIKPILDSQGPDGIVEMWGVDTPVGEIIGFGPWIIESYEIAAGVKLKRNDRYFEKDEWNNRLPYLDSFIQQNVADINTATLKFQNQELDSVFVQTSDFKTIVSGASSGDYTVWNGGEENYMRYLTFNMDPEAERMKGNPKSEWFNNKKFRHAMSYLIDRESLILQAYQGLAQPNNSLLTPASPYYDPNIVAPAEYNPKKGLKLLEEIGLRDRDGNNTLEDKNGYEVAFELMTNTGFDYKTKTVILIAKEWRSFGIDCTEILLDFNVVTDKSNSGEWDAQFGTISGNLFAAMDNVWLSDGNLHKWHPLQQEPYREWEAEIDRLHNEAEYEPDFETRKALWGEMYSILYDELPMITVVRKLDFRAFHNKWGNVCWDTYLGEFGGDGTKRLFDTNK